MLTARKKTQGGRRGNQHAKVASSQNGHLAKQGRTVDIIAKELGVGPATVARDAQFAAGVDELRMISPDAANKVLTGDSKVTKAEIMEIPKMEPEETKRNTPDNKTGTDQPPRPFICRYSRLDVTIRPARRRIRQSIPPQEHYPSKQMCLFVLRGFFQSRTFLFARILKRVNPHPGQPRYPPPVG